MSQQQLKGYHCSANGQTMCNPTNVAGARAARPSFLKKCNRSSVAKKMTPHHYPPGASDEHDLFFHRLEKASVLRGATTSTSSASTAASPEGEGLRAREISDGKIESIEPVQVAPRLPSLSSSAVASLRGDDRAAKRDDPPSSQSVSLQRAILDRKRQLQRNDGRECTAKKKAFVPAPVNRECASRGGTVLFSRSREKELLQKMADASKLNDSIAHRRWDLCVARRQASRTTERDDGTAQIGQMHRQWQSEAHKSEAFPSSTLRKGGSEKPLPKEEEPLPVGNPEEPWTMNDSTMLAEAVLDGEPLPLSSSESNPLPFLTEGWRNCGEKKCPLDICWSDDKTEGLDIDGKTLVESTFDPMDWSEGEEGDSELSNDTEKEGSEKGSDADESVPLDHQFDPIPVEEVGRLPVPSLRPSTSSAAGGTSDELDGESVRFLASIFCARSA